MLLLYHISCAIVAIALLHWYEVVEWDYYLVLLWWDYEFILQEFCRFFQFLHFVCAVLSKQKILWHQKPFTKYKVIDNVVSVTDTPDVPWKALFLMKQSPKNNKEQGWNRKSRQRLLAYIMLRSEHWKLHVQRNRTEWRWSIRPLYQIRVGNRQVLGTDVDLLIACQDTKISSEIDLNI